MREANVALLPIIAAGLLAAAFSPSHATPLPAPSPQVPDPGAAEPDITVTGERGGLSERIRSFVSSITAETGNSQVARWDRRLCLNVEGVSAGQREYFSGSISEAGRLVGLEVRPDRGCEASAYVIFSRNPDELLDRMSDSRPMFFGDILAARRRELQSSSAPVRWLSHAQLRGEAGETPTGFTIDLGKGGVERTLPALRSMPSRLQTGGRMDLQAMVVVVDASKLAGVSNRSLAAYLSMVVVGNVRPDHRADASHSILGLFDTARPGSVVTDGLTEWDEAYLRSLYAGAWNVTAEQRIREMGATMERRLVSAAPSRGR